MIRICGVADLQPESHMQASLGEEGALEGHAIQCTWHNGKFDIRTGAVLSPPCPVALKTYAVSLVDGGVFIEPV